MGSSQRIKACAYLRMSTDKQDTSIAIQEKRLLELAEANGYDIVQWYKDEGVSGSKDPAKRLDWMRLLSDAKAGTAPWEVVLCFNRSRFSRLDPIEEGFAKSILREAGKRLHCAAEGMMDWCTPTGIMIDTIHTVQANAFSVNLAHTSLEGKLNAFLNGKTYGQRCPYGLSRRFIDSLGAVHEISRKAPFTKPKDWIQTFVAGDPQEVDTVRWIFQTYVTKDVSTRWIAFSLNSRGLPAPDGGKWQHNIVRRVLRNVSYAGNATIGKQGRGKFARLERGKVVQRLHGTRLSAGQPLLREGDHEAIIDRDLWDLAQAKIKRTSKNRRRHLARGEGGYALKGILICGHCDRPMYGKRNTGKKKCGYVTYQCATGTMFGRNSGCAQWTIRESDIRSAIIGRLTDEIDMRLLAFYSVKPPTSINQTKNRVAALQRKLTELERQISFGAENVLSARPENRDVLESKLANWQVQRNLAQQELEEAKKPTPNLEDHLREWHEWFSAAKTQLIHVQANPATGTKFKEGEMFTPDAFRETLHRFGCRVICWWKKISGRRWEVDRVRILLGVAASDDGLSTPARAPDAESGKRNVDKSAENMEKSRDDAAQSGSYTTAYGPDCAAVIDVHCNRQTLFPQLWEHCALPLAIELRTAGESFRRIAEILTERGCPSGRGQLWDVRSVQSMLWRRAPDRGVRGYKRGPIEGT